MLAAAVVAAVGLLGAPVTAQDATVTLDLWTYRDTGLDELLERYGAEHPGVTVAVQARDYDGHHRDLLTALATGDVPDVAALGSSYISQFKASPDDFVDLRPLGAGDLVGDYVPWRWAQGVARDASVIGIPGTLGALAMCYRTDLFEAAGLPTDPDEVAALWPDWDAFIELGRRFTASSDRAFVDDAFGTVFQLIAHQGEGLYYDAAGDLVYATNPRVREAFDTSLAAVEAGLSAVIPPSEPGWDTGLAEGAFAVVGCPAQTIDEIERRAPDTAGRWGMTSVPGGGGAWGATQLVIAAASDHPRESFDLVAWLLSPAGQLERLRLGAGFPSTPALYDAPEVQGLTNAFFPGAPVGRLLAASAKSALPAHEGPQQRQIERELEATILDIERGRIAPDTAWDAAMERIRLAVQG